MAIIVTLISFFVLCLMIFATTITWQYSRKAGYVMTVIDVWGVIGFLIVFGIVKGCFQ